MADNVFYTEPGTGTIVAFRDDGGVKWQRIDNQGVVAHDIPVSGYPTLIGGYASALAPASVSSDGDLVRPWFLRDGTQVVQLSSSGTPITLGQKTMANSLPVVLASDLTGFDVEGTVANNAVDAGNPVKIGGKAVSMASGVTPVHGGDRVDFVSNRHGMPFHLGGHPKTVTQMVNAPSVRTNAIIASPATGSKLVVTRLMVTADNAMSTSPSVTVGFGASTTPTGNGVVLSHPGLPGGGGFAQGDGSGILAIGETNDKLLYTTGTITGGSVTIVAGYFEIES